ncbi:MAG: AAA family ATPase [Candidatus Symbiothrix sp.]|jgi:AAA15 family ATPase/GTPase|nr:AAA family ATPase [Candidatus Symbiothrix sp.]
MLDSLYIKNYRNLKEFKIDSVDQINLITGKNNTGKSTILEAIAIYASKGDLNCILQLLENRGEYFRQTELNNAIESNIRSLSSLFTNRIVKFNKTDAIRVGEINHTLFGDEISFEKSISLRFVKYIEEHQTDEQGEIIQRKRILSENENENKNCKIGFEIYVDGTPLMLPLTRERFFYRTVYKNSTYFDNFQFIRTGNIGREIIEKLFDNIALTEKENYVIEALKIIEPKTERIAFIKEENSRLRNAVIKLSDTSEVLPLKSMGDGINHILTTILALVNADNGFLLIDEFENGLHYTVQEQLWKIIFKLSQALNIQVFATTHSNDCISGFESILNSSGNTVKGKLIRLDNQNGEIKSVEYSPNELMIANEHNIETR